MGSASCPGAALARGSGLDRLTLAWDAPADCPDAAAVRERIQTHLPPGHQPGESWLAQGRIVVQGGRFWLELALRGPEFEGRRTLHDASCVALSEAAALLIALALDPRAIELPSTATPGLETEPAAPPESPPEAPPAQQPQTQPTPEAAPPKPQRTPASAAASEPLEDPAQHEASRALAVAFGVGLGAALDAGMLPQAPALGVRPQLDLRIGWLRAAAALTLWPSVSTNADGYTAATLRGRGLLASVALGVELVRAPLVLVPCAGVELGELAVEARDIASPGSGTATWLALEAGLRVERRLLGGLELTADALAVAPLGRPRFMVHTARGDIAAFTSAPLGLRVAIGLGYVFD